MTRKRKKKRFSAVTTVKEMAREMIGSPPPTRRQPQTKKTSCKREKHKQTLARLLEQGDR